MKAQWFPVSLLCFVFVSGAFPLFGASNIALSATLEKDSVPQGQAVNTPNSDIFISDQIQDVLKKAASTTGSGSNVNVEIKNGVVTLTGFVPDQTTKDRVVKLVTNVPGVKGVVDKLETKN